MFITIKINKQRLMLTIIILIIIVGLGIVGLRVLSHRGIQLENTTTANIGTPSNQDRINFIESFGWRVDSTPVENEEFKIPHFFDQIYKSYNEYQKDIGLDLASYKGKTIRRYTYKVLNYNLPKEYQGQQVYADVLTFNDKVIGGDLKTNQINGFMVSLKNRSLKDISGINEI